MNDADLVLRMDNLLRLCTDLIQRAQIVSEMYIQTAARIERIERALALPLTYSRAEACQRIGISVTTAKSHPELLPLPVSTGPYRYSVEEVEGMAAGGVKKGRRGAA